MSFPNMNTSLKINNRTRKSAFEKLSTDENSSNTNLHFEKSATLQELKTIKQKLQYERKNQRLKTIFLLLLLIAVLTITFLYL